jgi:hypothetical protein
MALATGGPLNFTTLVGPVQDRRPVADDQFGFGYRATPNYVPSVRGMHVLQQEHKVTGFQAMSAH